MCNEMQPISPAEQPKAETTSRPDTKNRWYRWFTEALKLNARPFVDFDAIQIIGLEHLDHILQTGEPAIFLVSHRDDLSMQIVAHLLAKRIPIMLTNEGTQYSIKTDPAAYLAMKVADLKRRYFMPIAHAIVNGKKEGIFDFNNLGSMANKMKEGWSLVIAAHRPNTDPDTFKLGRGGKIGPALAELTGASILPIAVEPSAGYEKPVLAHSPGAMLSLAIKYCFTGKPTVTVHVGEPIRFGSDEKPIFDEEILAQRIAAIKDREKNKDAQQPSFFDRTREISKEVMRRIANMLPAPEVPPEQIEGE